MFRTPTFRACCVAAALASGSAARLAAQDAAPEPWVNTVSIYGWGVAMTGTTGVGPYTADVDVTFSEILDNLKMGAMLNYQGRGEKFLAVADFIYMKLGDDLASPVGGSTVAEVKLKQWLMEADGGYRVLPWLDVLIGVRIPVIELEVVPDRENPVISAKSKSVSWIAPLFGVRAEVPLSRKFTVIARGDVGGFNLGGTNETWQAAGYLNYRFSTTWSVTAGYRALNADYRTGTGAGSFLYDVTNAGPLVGVSYSF